MFGAEKGTADRLDGKALYIGIVQARFNESITDALATACLAELEALGVNPKHIDHVRVPGALEVSVALQALADAMGLPTARAAAEGFVAIAVEQMARATDRISTERGFDPRDHALTAFGGAAGQVACEVADALGPSEILCPKYGSVLSAWGIGQAQIASLRQRGHGGELTPSIISFK